MQINSFSRLCRRVCDRLAGKISGLGRNCFATPMEKRVVPWFAIDGDKTLRLDYDCLTHESVVFDVGGYQGQWTSDLFSKYCCNIYVFEPVPQFYANIVKRFEKNKKIKVYNAGLASKTETARITVADSASSTYLPGDNLQEIALKDIIEFIKDNDITHIDLLKINIEGGEYALLTHLIDTGYVRDIGNIQVQFHDFVDNAEEKRQAISTQLSKTHVLTYQFPFVWENWQRSV